MAAAPLHPSAESRVLASTRDSALLATFVAGLPNTVLVQLSNTRGMSRRSFSVYAVYREGTTTFEAIVGFEIDRRGARLAEVLRRFVRGSDCRTAIFEPLIQTVREHHAAAAGAD